MYIAIHIHLLCILYSIYMCTWYAPENTLGYIELAHEVDISVRKAQSESLEIFLSLQETM